MNIRTILYILLILPINGICHAESQTEQAKTPYAAIYKIVTTEIKQIEAIGNREPRFFASSQLPETKPQDIKLYIDSKNGKIPLQINNDGSFSLPLRDDLLKENPFIITNQPKGTMQIEMALKFSGKYVMNTEVASKNHKVRYSDLFGFKTLTEKATNKFVENARGRVDHINVQETAWLSEFTATEPAKTPAVIHNKGNDINVYPDPDGVIRIKYDSKLAEENPFVTFPGRGKLKVFNNAGK